MSELPKSIKLIDYQNFIHYFHIFHSPAGLYTTTRWASDADIIAAINKIDEFEGDTIDREKVRDLVFSPVEIENMYKKES